MPTGGGGLVQASPSLFFFHGPPLMGEGGFQGKGLPTGGWGGDGRVEG